VTVVHRFGGTYHLHLQGLRVSQGRNQHEVGSKQSLYLGFEVFTAVVMNSIIFWDIAPCSPFLRNVGWNSTDYTASYPRRWYSSEPLSDFHPTDGFLSQKIEHFIATAVRTSNPTEVHIDQNTVQLLDLVNWVINIPLSYRPRISSVYELLLASQEGCLSIKLLMWLE
jgi:hypothetical protein